MMINTDYKCCWIEKIDAFAWRKNSPKEIKSCIESLKERCMSLYFGGSMVGTPNKARNMGFCFDDPVFH